MGRTKGSINKNTDTVPDTVRLTTEERIEFIANLIVDRIDEEQVNDKALLNSIGSGHEVQRIITA